MLTRGKRSISAVVNGQKTKFSHSLKDGIALAYWYYIQFPCGGWREFDIRTICAVSSDDFYFSSNAERLRLVAELIADIDVFSMIRQSDLAAA